MGDVKNYPYIYNLELLSNQPIAKNIIKAITDNQSNLKLTNFSEQPGKGVSTTFENKELILISYQKSIQKFRIINNNIENIIILLKQSAFATSMS